MSLCARPRLPLRDTTTVRTVLLPSRPPPHTWVEVEGSNAAAELHINGHMEAVRWVARRVKPRYGTISTVHTEVLRTMVVDETELVGLAAYLFLARHSAECADQICKELPRGTRRIGRTGLERQHPCKPFTRNLARELIANRGLWLGLVTRACPQWDRLLYLAHQRCVL